MRRRLLLTGLGAVAALLVRRRERLASLLPGRVRDTERPGSGAEAEAVQERMTAGLPDDQLGVLPADETLARPEHGGEQPPAA